LIAKLKVAPKTDVRPVRLCGTEKSWADGADRVLVSYFRSDLSGEGGIRTLGETMLLAIIDFQALTSPKSSKFIDVILSLILSFVQDGEPLEAS